MTFQRPEVAVEGPEMTVQRPEVTLDRSKVAPQSRLFAGRRRWDDQPPAGQADAVLQRGLFHVRRAEQRFPTVDRRCWPGRVPRYRFLDEDAAPRYPVAADHAVRVFPYGTIPLLPLRLLGGCQLDRSGQERGHRQRN